jgi:D-lactate dehydrogenase
MKTLVYSTHSYDKASFVNVIADRHELTFTQKKLGPHTALLSKGYDAVSLFTSDNASTDVIVELKKHSVKYIALRSVGYDHVDLQKASELGIQVANVPEYSPYSIAEHAVAMLLAVNRKLVQSRHLMALQDFRLDMLTGSDIHGKTIGIIGAGKIGVAFASIMKGFGASVLAYDPVINSQAVAIGAKYVSIDELLATSDVVSLHCSLNAKTRHLISKDQFQKMKKDCVLINTSRGAVIDTQELIKAIETNKLGAACLDVYEYEKELFFEDHTRDTINDPMFARLQAFPNVLITGHQAFLTKDALNGIATTTGQNLDCWESGKVSPNTLTKK